MSAKGKKRTWKVWVPLSENGTLVHEYINPRKSWIPMPRGGSIHRGVITLSPAGKRPRGKKGST